MKAFTPKSTSYLKPGHFWGIPIDNHQFGCGIVLSKLLRRDGTRHSRLFLGGLLDWTGNSPPSAVDIRGSDIIEVRFVHIKAILMSGGEVIGEVEPWWDWPGEMPNNDKILTAGYNVLTMLAKDHSHRMTLQGEQITHANALEAGA